jgi:hypothetical protein
MRVTAGSPLRDIVDSTDDIDALVGSQRVSQCTFEGSLPYVKRTGRADRY